MLRLETVEDFEKAKKALDNPESKPWHYTVKSFGYCPICHKVTEYVNIGNLMEGCSNLCLNCHNAFSPRSNVSSVYLIYVSNTRFMPDWARVEVLRLHSREEQKKFFNEALEELISMNKAKGRQAKNITRRLAKLR